MAELSQTYGHVMLAARLGDEVNKLKIEIGNLKKELQSLEEDIHDEKSRVGDDHALIGISKQLGIIVIPNMPQWALLLEIERSIEKMKKGI